MTGQSNELPNVANGDRLLALNEAIERRRASAAGAQTPRTRTTAKSSKSRWVRRGAIALLALCVLVAGGVIGDYYYLGSLLHHKHVNFLQTAASTENILLIGSTDRCALKVQNAAYGLCQDGVNGINSDIVMILHLNLSTGAASLLSIPRDTFIPNARTASMGSANKIDAALVEGPSQLVDAIEEDFAVPINHYVELNFDTFADVVNALGGIKMYFPTPVFDAESGLKILRPGCYYLNGYHALQVVRARHLQIQPSAGDSDFRSWPQEAESDIARIRRTHEFLRVLASKIAANGLSNPLTDQHLAASVIGSLEVDQNFSENHMISLAQHFSSVNVGSIPQLTYPVAEVNGGSYLYQGYYYGDVEFPMNPTGASVLEKIFGTTVAENTFTYAALPSPSTIAVSIENGSNITGQAGVVAAGLRAHGFKIAGVGTRTPDGTANETIVWYGGGAPPAAGNWKSPGLAAAQAVMRELSGPVVMGYDPAEVTPGSIVTVQTGDALSVISAKAATTSTKKVASTTTPAANTTTSTSSTSSTGANTSQYQQNSSSLLQPTSPTDQALQPWDPRPCAPGEPQYVDTSK